MKLLVAVINDPDRVVEILDRFHEIGVKGATVLESSGMAHMIADHVPFFTRFAEMGVANAGNSRTLFSIMRDEANIEKAIAAIDEVIGGLDQPDTGMVFLLPVDRCMGVPGLGVDSR